jgi:hypothetical protein
MEETSKNNETPKFGLGDIITRLFIIGLIWAGMFHLYTTIFNTHWTFYSDLISSFCASWLPFYNKGFTKWFLNDL